MAAHAPSPQGSGRWGVQVRRGSSDDAVDAIWGAPNTGGFAMSASASRVDGGAAPVSRLGRRSQGAAELRLIDAATSTAHPVSKLRSFFTPAKLEAYVAVVEEGGFSAGARRLYISQPALSRTINAL